MSLVQIAAGVRRPVGRLPEWLRKPTSHARAVHDLKVELRNQRLHTVCESARCPNMHDCFSRKSATFMILGNVCTRRCGFCAVPQGVGLALDPSEPQQVAEMAQRMELKHVVITSVNRDELPDGGSAHFADAIQAVSKALPAARIEVLTPDFLGDRDAIARVLDAGPHIFNHNMETVSRLYSRVRPQAEYQRSLDVLAFAKTHRPGVLTKSGVMVGLGESRNEVRLLLQDLRSASVDIATIGQYLQPRRNRLPVEAFIEPAVFDEYRAYGESIGFRNVFSGPFVRSSYMADIVAEEAEAC